MKALVFYIGLLFIIMWATTANASEVAITGADTIWTSSSQRAENVPDPEEPRVWVYYGDLVRHDELYDIPTENLLMDTRVRIHYANSLYHYNLNDISVDLPMDVRVIFYYANSYFTRTMYRPVCAVEPMIMVNPAGLIFNGRPGAGNPEPQKIAISNPCFGGLEWSVSDNANWLNLNPTNGSCADEIDEVTVTANISGLTEGEYNANITITAVEAANTPFVVPVVLRVTSTTAFNCELPIGWSLISFPVGVCFYDGEKPDDQPVCVEIKDIADLGFSSLASWFSSVIIPSDGWEMVIGANGAMDRSLPDIFHSLRYMSPCSGYWVKIGEEGATLSLSGPPFDISCPIPLQDGWNLVGCPLGKGYHDTNSPPTEAHVPEDTTWEKVDSPVAAYVFKSIKGKYDMVIGENGAYNANLPSDFNSLHYIAPGYGFWIKMKEAADLIYSQASSAP